MIKPYREIFQVPGSLAFSSAAFIGRMPVAMTVLGIITMFAQTHGEYTIAGVVASVFSCCKAMFGPQVSRLVDRYGQRRVLPVAAGISATFMLALLWLARMDAPAWTLFVCAAGAGCMPNMGAMVKARWTALLAQPSPRRTAYALESVLDEVAFIIGPPLSIGLSVAWFPGAGLLAALTLQLVGVGAFVLQTKTEPGITPAAARHGPSPLKIAGIRILLLLMFSMGVIAGTIDIVSIAFADDQGIPAAASVVLAAYAIGSCVAGLMFGAMKTNTPLARLLLYCGVATALSTVPLVFVHGIASLAIVMFVGGLFFAPTMIVVMTLVEEMVPSAKLTEGFTWMISGLGVGVALGAGTSGKVVDVFGVRAGFAVALCAGVVAIIAVARAQPGR